MVGQAKAGADVFARHAAQGKERQTLAGRNHCAGVALGDCQGPALHNVQEQFLELVGCLGSEDDAIGDQALEVAFLVTLACAAASRALTAPTSTARDGSALSLS